MKLTKKRKEAFRRLINPSFVLVALSSDYQEQEEESFIDTYGVDFKEMENILDEIVYRLGANKKI